MALLPESAEYSDISQSCTNALLLAGEEDTWHNRVLFYTGQLHAWKSEVVQDRSQQAYIRLLQKMIDEAKELREFTAQVVPQ